MNVLKEWALCRHIPGFPTYICLTHLLEHITMQHCRNVWRIVEFCDKIRLVPLPTNRFSIFGITYWRTSWVETCWKLLGRAHRIMQQPYPRTVHLGKESTRFIRQWNAGGHIQKVAFAPQLGGFVYDNQCLDLRLDGPNGNFTVFHESIHSSFAVKAFTMCITTVVESWSA